MKRLLAALAMAGCAAPTAPPPPTPSPTAATPTPTASMTEPVAPTAAPEVVSEASAPDETSETVQVIASGAVDGATLRARHVPRLKDGRWPVVVLKGTSPLELGKQICERVVPKRPAETPVLLKPNICGFHALKKVKAAGDDDGIRGRITDPAFTRGVVQCLKSRGHTAITISDGCAIGHDMWRKVIAVSGYEAMAREENVPLVALDDDGYFDTVEGTPGKPLRIDGMKETRVPTLMMPTIVAEHLQRGLFITLPKLKAHRYSVVSVAIKNMQGVVMRADRAPAHKQKWRMHAELHRWLKNEARPRADYVQSLELFAERLADVLEVALPHAVLVDGAPAMSGDGFDVILPSERMVALGGTNPVTVDKVSAQLLGLWNNAALGKQLGGYTTSPLITIAAKRYGLNLDEVRVIGSGKDLAPERARYRAMADFTLGL